MTYPIAETFHSIQGEGTWTGTPMFFIRLAGCNVGKYTPIAMQQPLETDPTDLRVLRASHPLHSVCTTFAGDKFLCDTDYHKSYERNDNWLYTECQPFRHVCITGGEPFLHDLSPLIDRFNGRGITVHIETSGTLLIPKLPYVWITCSPKEGFLIPNAMEVDEWKFLIGPDTSMYKIEESLLGRRPHSGEVPVYLQPIGDLTGHFQASLDNCWRMLQLRPQWKLSAQLHKYLRFR